jgi:hypothetical protein
MKRNLLIFNIILTIIITSCVSNELDLSNGIKTDIVIGGDSLSLPIGKTAPIILGNIVSKANVDILQKSEDGSYSIHLKDSISPIKPATIDPIPLPISPISITPIKQAFTANTFPDMTLAPNTTKTNLPIPTIDISSFNLQPIDASYTKTYTIAAPSMPSSPVKKYSPTARVANSKNLIIPETVIDGNSSVNQNLSFNFPSTLKRIDGVMLANNKVIMTFDKSKINAIGFSSQSDMIKSFRIDFPAEFKLSRAVGTNAAIVGSSFVITDAPLSSTTDIYTASFYIDSIDLSGVAQNNSLNYNVAIPYSISYSFSGEIASLSPLDIEYKIGVKSSPTVDDMDIVTNDIQPDIPAGKQYFNSSVTGISDAVSHVFTVSYGNGATLNLNLTNPNINPFSFNAGSYVINLPKSFIFKPFNGLNTTTNVLTIPYTDLYTPHAIGISGMNINKDIPQGTGSLAITDSVSYNSSGLTLGSQKTRLKVIQGMNNKTIISNESTTGLSVVDAAITTNKVYLDMPITNSNISINKFISADVKHIYSAKLKTASAFNLKLSIANLPPEMTMIYFDNFTIKLPDELKFTDPTPRLNETLNANNEIVLNSWFVVKDGFTKTIFLDSIVFGAGGNTLTNGNFSYSGNVKMSGRIHVNGTNLNTSSLGTITITPTVDLNPINLSLIEADLATTIPSINQKVALNLPTFFKEKGNCLDLKKPVITLQVGNSMGIAVDADLSIIPKLNGVPIANATITTKMSIAAASVLGQTTWSNFWISAVNEGVSAGYTPLILPNIANLLKVAPDEIELVATPAIVGNRQKVDLYSPKNQIDLKYTVNVPLAFGEEFKIQFKDTIVGLKDKLKDIVKVAKQVEVMAIIDNSIPLDLGFGIKALDAAKQPLGVAITNLKDSVIKSCDISGKAQKSILVLSLKETKAGDLALLDALQFGVSASNTSTTAGMPLNSKQYFIVELRVVIPNGIHIDPNAKKIKEPLVH